MKYVMLTQDNCNNCERLKLLLAKPMKGEFDSIIDKVHRQSEPERFLALVREYQVATVPVLINLESKEVMTRFDNGLHVKRFLQGDAR